MKISSLQLQKIKAYVLGDNKEPLVIHGESGCGKTSIMALAAKEAYFWIHGKGMVIARRVLIDIKLENMNRKSVKYFNL